MKLPKPKLLLLVGTAAVDPGAAPFCTVEVLLLEPPPPLFDTAPPVGFVVGVGVDDVVVVGVELVALFAAVLPAPELLLVV